MRGHAVVARQLLDGGAHADARDVFGRMPADWAVMNGWRSVAELFGQPAMALPTGSLPPLHGRILETGIKVVGVVTPLPLGGTIRTTAQGGVGKMVLLAEIVHRLARRAFAPFTCAGMSVSTAPGTPHANRWRQASPPRASWCLATCMRRRPCASEHC